MFRLDVRNPARRILAGAAVAAAVAACGLVPSGPPPAPERELGVILENRTAGEVEFAYESRSVSSASSGGGIAGGCQSTTFTLQLGGTWRIAVAGDEVADQDGLPQLRPVAGGPRDWTLTLRVDPSGVTMAGLRPGRLVEEGGVGPIGGCP